MEVNSKKNMEIGVNDSEKIQDMAQLYTLYSKACHMQYSLLQSMNLDSGTIFVKKIKEFINDRGNPDSSEVLTKLEMIERSIDKIKNIKNEFTIEKMSGLAQDDNNVDINFLKLHGDKITEHLNILQDDINKRNQLSKKIFKSKADKEEIARLDRNIESINSNSIFSIKDYYDRIVSLLNFYFGGVVPLSTRVEMNPSNPESCIEAVNNAYDIADRNIPMIKQIIEMNIEKEKILETARKLAGTGYENASMPYCYSDDSQNVKLIFDKIKQEEDSKTQNNIDFTQEEDVTQGRRGR